MIGQFHTAHAISTSGELLIDLSQRVGQAPVRTNVSLSVRLAHEIPRPRNWLDFQRGCVILFREELRDPNTMVYGRGVRSQGGIDVPGGSKADPNRYVGIQCRRVSKPLKQAKILADCRDALEAGLNEIIFATLADRSRTAAGF